MQPAGSVVPPDARIAAVLTTARTSSACVRTLFFGPVGPFSQRCFFRIPAYGSLPIPTPVVALDIAIAAAVCTFNG